VFTERDGRPWSLDRWRRKVWTRARLRAGVEPARVYDLRHTAATAALYDGVPLHVVHQRLGHASPLTTFRYSHIVEKARIDGSQPTLEEQISRARAQAERQAAKRQTRLDRLDQAVTRQAERA
jgi:integrase